MISQQYTKRFYRYLQKAFQKRAGDIYFN